MFDHFVTSGLLVFAVFCAWKMAVWSRNVREMLAAEPQSSRPRLYKGNRPTTDSRIALGEAEVSGRDCYAPLNRAVFARESELPPILPPAVQTFLPFDPTPAAAQQDAVEVWVLSDGLSRSKLTSKAIVFREESVALSDLSSIAAPADRALLVGQFMGQEDTDPIDGVALSLGEPVVHCDCGLVYRQESVDWLNANCEGRCVQCNKLPKFCLIYG